METDRAMDSLLSSRVGTFRYQGTVLGSTSLNRTTYCKMLKDENDKINQKFNFSDLKSKIKDFKIPFNNPTSEAASGSKENLASQKLREVL